MKTFKILFGLIGAGVLFLGPVYAIDFGDQPAAQTQAASQDAGSNGKVEVTNLPVQLVTKKIDNEDKEIPYMRVMASDYFIQEMGKDISLANGETFESEMFDVREYKEVSFYVVPDSVLGEQADAVYQLDAFFSITSSAQKIQKMGEKAGGNANGRQEFGSMKADEDGKVLPSFQKLTTGVTSTKVLSTKVYGPFVSVALKNLSPDSKRRYKIIAYLSR